jgi:tetratricopeptide (TPR) repeat protein
VRGAVAQTAEAVYRRLPPEQQPVARSIFLRMAEVGEDSQDTRRRATYDELITRSTDELVIDAVVRVLIDARLVTTDTLQPGGEKVVQVSHECLIREWPTLRAWLDEDCESLILHQRLAEAADEWQKMDRDPGALYRSARLKAAQEWAAGRSDSLSLLEQDFLESSRQVAEQEAEQSRRLARAKTVQRVFTGVTTVLLLAVAYLAYTYFFNKQPAVMNGFFNIAIASVSGANTGGDETSPGFSELLYGGLSSELGNSPNVLVWRDSPELRNLNVTIGPVEGNTPQARSLAAAEIASRLHADMVIYGANQSGPGDPLNTAVEPSADDRKYSLEFYLAPRQGYDFEDLEGGFDLGCAISLASQPNSASIQSELAPCASALPWIALGLSEAQVGHSLEALEAFLKAANYFPTSEVIQFLIGREYLFLVDRESVLEFVQDEFYAQAAKAFTVSTTINPDYPRAYIGLGAVDFKQARDLTLQDDLSPERLNQAMELIDQSLAANQKALENAGDPGTAGLPIESVAHLGLGNGLQWKGRILLYQDQPEQALQHFEHAIQELEPIIQSFQQAGQARYLAQTYEFLGSAYQWKGYTSELGQAYADGLAAYQSALTYFDLCIAQAESTQDFIIRENVVGEVCQPNREYVQEQITRLGGTQ